MPIPVSYTHLDVYKRQIHQRPSSSCERCSRRRWSASANASPVRQQKTAYEIASGDWSSDVCSSDLVDAPRGARRLDPDALGQEPEAAADTLNPSIVT